MPGPEILFVKKSSFRGIRTRFRISWKKTFNISAICQIRKHNSLDRNNRLAPNKVQWCYEVPDIESPDIEVPATTMSSWRHWGPRAKTPWSWGRMDDILSEGRKIESRRQLEAIYRTNWKRNKRTPVNDHRRAGGRSKWTRSEARKKEKETRFEGCGLRKREKDVKGGRNSTKHSKDELQHETRPVGAPASCFIKCYPSSRS